MLTFFILNLYGCPYVCSLTFVLTFVTFGPYVWSLRLVLTFGPYVCLRFFLSFFSEMLLLICDLALLDLQELLEKSSELARCK